MRARSAGGFSLFELIVSFGLLALMMLLTYQMLVPGLRAWTVANRHSEVQQNTLVGVTRVAHDVQQTYIGSMKTDTYRDDLGVTRPYDAFISPLDHDTGRFMQDPDTGGIKWQEYRVFYVDLHGNLALGSRDLRYDSSKNVIYLMPSFSPEPADRVLTRNVTSFIVQPTMVFGGYDPTNGFAPVEQPANPVQVRVRVHDDRDLENYELQTSVWALLPTN